MICHFLLRRQRLCFAVARIFVRGLTYPEAVRESTRRMLRYSLPLVVLPCGRRMALVSDAVSEILLSLCAGASPLYLLYIKSATGVTGFIAVGNIF